MPATRLPLISPPPYQRNRMAMNPMRHLSACKPADCQSQYVIRDVFTDFPQIYAQWQRDSAAARDVFNGQLDLPYAGGENCKLDLFMSGQENSPLMVFLHGGYWQGGDKRDVTFIAAGFLEKGISVAIPNYSLAPGATVAQMLDETRTAFAWLWENASRWSINRDRIYVMGHSAGGHLAAMMLTEAWMPKNQSGNGELIRAAFAISGLYDLRPLMHTSLNNALSFTPETAALLSPVDHVHQSSAPLYSFVGELETQEFHVQADLICKSWRDAKPATVVQGTHHYTVLAPFADPASNTFATVLAAIENRHA